MPARNQKKKSRPADVSCKAATDVLTDYVEGRLDQELNLAFERHLGACTDCVGFLKTYKKTLQLTRSFLAGESPEPDLTELRTSLNGKLPRDRDS